MHKSIFYLVILFFIADIGFAAVTGGSLPWESPLSTIKDSLTGPVAGIISIIAIVSAGAMLIFGGDFSGFIRSLVYVVLVISIVIGANTFLTSLFGVSGAVIPRSLLINPPDKVTEKSR